MHAIDITKNVQFGPIFREISPNNKIPAIVDKESGVRMMESGAILIYLAEKTGRLLAPRGEDRLRAIEWLMWQIAGFGPTLGQAHHFLHCNPSASDYAAKRFAAETARLYRVLDERLAQRDYVAGDYSIADIAIWPWVSHYEWHRTDLAHYPNVLRWYAGIARRPAVQRGYEVPHFVSHLPVPAT